MKSARAGGNPAGLDGADQLTRTSAGDGSVLTPSSSSGGTSSSGLIDHGRFPPGHLLAGRYRIIELLGKGGMGEVYRADDLMLGQSIALKFLLGAQAEGEENLAALVREVRVARQVSHANVCRVHDIGVAEGHAFITMEYVDGENLGSLVRRIGRLSPDKSLDIAQQLCLALAAAHEQGILHRDLKPSNVMIDGRGKVRITDFGLAGIADQFQAGELRAGTPAYMAPEQLSGREVTPRSDVYALGLILYEVFTGHRALSGNTLAEISRAHAESSPTLPSTHVAGLDIAVERVILRCLEKDPSDRPPTAKAVLAGLPGFDPLSAALAAGETPSPEVVAAAGPTGGLPPLAALALLLVVLAGLPLYALLSAPGSLLSYVVVDKPPSVLADRAREMLARMGFEHAPADTAYGFRADSDYTRYLRQRDRSPQRWDALRQEHPAAVSFWYRESPSPLVSQTMNGRVTPSDPPAVGKGMILLRLTPGGRLASLRAVPEPGAPTTTAPAAVPSGFDWAVVFDLAGLRMGDFEPAAPEHLPPFYAEQRVAWVSRAGTAGAAPLRIEAASFAGRPVYFELLGPWSTADDAAPTRGPATRALAIVNATLIVLTLTGAGWLARRNLRSGRGDRVGARRLALLLVAVSGAAWLLTTDHVPNVQTEINAAIRACGVVAFRAGLAWLLYLALEPAIRRRWPDAMISWTRLLTGRLNDPTVGRAVLIGAAISVVTALLGAVRRPVAVWLGAPPLEPDVGSLDALLMTRQTLATLVDALAWSVSGPLFLLFIVVLMLVLVRRRDLAAILACVVAAAIAVPVAMMESEHKLTAGLTAVLTVALIGVTLLRFGLLALMAYMYVQNIMGFFVEHIDLSRWYAANALAAAAVLALIACAAFYTSLAGKPLFRSEVLDQ
ncbi:MAG: Serine/threonine-protein kinase PknD [Phycisphaerae bacterium]|nr:Serine/threonine-protein kinase PknD [Phycisphaerae bacterium]